MQQNTMIWTASAAALATGLLAYAVYFDHQRRTSSEFRRQLRRNERKQARVEKDGAEAAEGQRLELIRQAVDEIKLAGFPTGVEEKEQFFNEQVTIGEALANDPTKTIECALHFYCALKVYPSPGDLIPIYNSIVAKPTLDVLAEMIAYDKELKLTAASAPAAAAGKAGPLDDVVDVDVDDMPPAAGLD
ncbi:hypothetical protein MCOR25_000929 [Pyricularia grisea]|uniref:Mitochondrial import receptor subunit tom-20 n=1 Tax=Pyricularia grisea TaxID=148305 RepID=A0A6P8BKD9_PYRGI|nr:uncharacterized protein PgNI_01775 [Pyricularia grisea]KAI6382052.1 hypothetical protein MCOR25_000929 [Pyricularia grisea]TLD17125.1 hypothetical protein PgNI_01775 [Pyricularia grisea]